MRKFIYKLTIYIIIIVLITLGINYYFAKTDARDSDYTLKFKYIPDNIEICNVGSSHGLFGYNYEDLSNRYSCFNFGLVSQTLSYDYRLLDYYQDNIDKGAIVFVTVSYFSFFGQNEEYYTNDFVSKNKRYYKILDAAHIKQYDYKISIWEKYFPALVARFDLIRSVLGMQDIGHSDWSQTADMIDLTTDVEGAYNRHLGIDKYNDGNLIINKNELDALYSIIELCEERKWIPIVITTPYLSEYSDAAWNNSSEALNTMYSLIDEVVKAKGVEYYDYSLDDRFCRRYDYFMNGDHLNQEGAKEFVDILENEVIKKVYRNKALL